MESVRSGVFVRTLITMRVNSIISTRPGRNGSEAGNRKLKSWFFLFRSMLGSVESVTGESMLVVSRSVGGSANAL